PSKFSKLGGFNRIVFNTSGILHPQRVSLPALIRILPRSGGAAGPFFLVPRLPQLVYPSYHSRPTTKCSLFSIPYTMPAASGSMRPFLPKCWALGGLQRLCLVSPLPGGQAITATVSNTFPARLLSPRISAPARASALEIPRVKIFHALSAAMRTSVPEPPRC